MVVLLALFAGIQLQQFNKKNIELQQSSTALHQDLEQNFHNLRLLTDIQAHLRKYLQSAAPDSVHTIHQLADTLNRVLPMERQEQLDDFLGKLDTLTIRMNSFKLNNKSLFVIEREIIQNTDTVLVNVPMEFRRDIRRLTSQVCLEHHDMYIQLLMTDDQEAIARLTQQYEHLFTDIEKKITDLNTVIPEKNRQDLKNLQNSFYKLDESLATITAIRGVTLETRKDITNSFLFLREVVTEDSLSRVVGLTTLIESGMSFLKINLIVMSVIMVIGAFLGGITAMVINQTMVKPLMAFTEMLKKMTGVLAGLRNERNIDRDMSDFLDPVIDQRRNEIGQVASAVKELVVNLRDLALFRQDIEADESTGEIYERLGRIFSTQLHLDSFVIFELSEDRETMTRVLEQFKIEGLELPQEKKLTGECRCRRNISTISSLKDSRTCYSFPMSDTLRHICVPMQFSGEVIGVVQFLFPADGIDAKQTSINEHLSEARHYIEEALPVLHVKRLTNRLQSMATKDQLTGLFNRHYLEMSLPPLLAGIQRRKSDICILMCDLDHFKQINDTHGHDAGDEVLIQLAQILRNNFRETDLIIRFGGEEFMILLVDCNPEYCRTQAERIRKEVENKSFRIPNNIIGITISIGTALYPSQSKGDVHKTFKQADLALYHAKETGRNRIVDYSETDQARAKSTA